MVSISPNAKEAYRLLHEGNLALAEIERNGINIDQTYCRAVYKHLDKKIERLEEKLDNSKEIKLWRRLYRNKFNRDSDSQLRDLLFNHLRLKPTKETNKGDASVDREALESIKLPMIKDLVQWRKLQKAKNTYIYNIMQEARADGLLHPFFNLHLVRTFRSSSSSPNFQNLPVRDNELMQTIRSAFVPRPGRRLGGVDYSGIEVRIATCYHQDPNMIAEINDPMRDMHRDAAMDCFRLKQKQMTSRIRYCGKNMFVFPQFYGDYFKSCATALWNAIDLMGLETEEGIPLREHLRNQGIGTYKKFESHIEDVEHVFWHEKFRVYSEWKEDWIKAYNKRGYIDMFTGFRCSGVMGQNDVVNYPVQGAAFHCLLWSIVELLKWMKKESLETLIVGQIHDEITSDVIPDEMDHYLKNTHRIMCKDIRDAWDWIIVPLEIEAEFTEVDESWSKKQKYPIVYEEKY